MTRIDEYQPDRMPPPRVGGDLAAFEPVLSRDDSPGTLEIRRVGDLAGPVPMR
jgi:hypothetical protein